MSHRKGSVSRRGICVRCDKDVALTSSGSRVALCRHKCVGGWGSYRSAGPKPGTVYEPLRCPTCRQVMAREAAA